MELRYEHGGIIIENKVFTALDKFVADFTKVLEEYIDYVIVSGYVVILFGRARGTEDIDTIIKRRYKSDEEIHESTKRQRQGVWN